MRKNLFYFIGFIFLFFLAGNVSAQVTFNPSNPANGAVVTNPLAILNISLGSINNIDTHYVLLNDYNKYEVGYMVEDLASPVIVKPLCMNVTFRKNIMADSVLTGGDQYIMRVYGDVWNTGNNVTKNELHASDNVYYRKYNNYLFFDGDSSVTYTRTSDLNVWKTKLGETGSVISSSPSTLLNIMQNPALPENDPKSYLRTASSEALALGAGANIDFTKEPWITWFPDSCSPEGSTTSCIKNDYDGNHNGVRTCTGGKWSACGGFTDYTEAQICAGASLSPRKCYFIDPVSGSDSTGDGSMASPWQTLNTVFTVGDVSPTKTSLSGSGKKTVVLRGGTFNVCSSGSPGAICVDIYGSYNNIIVRNYPGESPKIVAPTFDNGANPTVAMRVGSWGRPPVAYNITIDGLDIQGGSYYSFKFSDSFNNITLRNCKLHNSGADVIGSKGMEYTTNINNFIENCEIYNASAASFDASGPAFQHNDEGVDIMASGGLTIRNNYIHDITGNCLYYKGGSRNALVENNFCYNTGKSAQWTATNDFWCGIWLGESENPDVDSPYPNIYSLLGGTVRNNILAKCNGNAFRAMGAKNAEFYGNTLYNNDRPNLAGWGSGTFGGGFAAAQGTRAYAQYALSVIKKDGLFNFASQDVILNWDGVNQTNIITFNSMNTIPRFINHTLNNDWYAKVNLTAGTHTYYAWVLENSGAYHQTETRTITYLPGASPDVNGDGKVNVIDLAIVIYNQGHKSTDGNWNNYDHLDLDSDNAVDFDDVKIVGSSII